MLHLRDVYVLVLTLFWLGWTAATSGQRPQTKVRPKHFIETRRDGVAAFMCQESSGQSGQVLVTLCNKGTHTLYMWGIHEGNVTINLVMSKLLLRGYITDITLFPSLTKSLNPLFFYLPPFLDADPYKLFFLLHVLILFRNVCILTIKLLGSGPPCAYSTHLQNLTFWQPLICTVITSVTRVCFQNNLWLTIY